MSRITVLIIVLLLIVGGVIFLSSAAREVPLTTIETDVSPGPNAR
jgi:preprotein translocase subunit SecY